MWCFRGPPSEERQDANGAAPLWRVHALHLVLPALASWATALALLGCPPLVSAAVAGVAAVGALSATVMIPADGIAGWRNAVIGVLGCVAAVAGTVALHVHAISTGPVAEMAERRASATVEAVVTDDPGSWRSTEDRIGGRVSWCPRGSRRWGSGRPGRPCGSPW